MKKNLFFAALAVVALASCSKVEVVEQSPVAQGTPIAFNNYTAGATKAVTETDAAKLQANGFQVTAVIKDASDSQSASEFFVDQVYKYTSSNYDHVGTSTVYYWPNTTQYMDFFAVYPSGKTVTLSATKLDATIAYTSYSSDDFNEDVVTAKKAGESCAAHTTTATDVALTFGHIKNQVAFSFCSNSTDANLTTTVKSVKLTYANAGTYTYSTNAWTSLSYESTTPKTYYSNATGTAVEKAAATQTYTSIGDAIAMIPAATALTVTVEYVVTQSVNSATVTLSDFTGSKAKSFEITPSDLNKKYRYNVKLPTDLRPITFTATVSGWGDESAVAVADTDVNN